MRIINYFFPIMTLEERIEKWCHSINKDKSYGEKMTHEKLNEIGFKKRKFKFEIKTN